MKNQISAVILIILGVTVLWGCEQEQLTSFNTDLSSINFTTDSTSYSFLGNLDNEYIKKVEVMIMGTASDQDRYFEVEVIDNDLTTAAKEDYEILEGLVKAGEYSGYLYVKLLNSEKLADASVSLNLRLIESDDFGLGTIQARQFVLTWTDMIIVPDWTYYSYFFTAQPSVAAYRAIVESVDLLTFTLSDYQAVGPAGAEALGRVFGDHVREYNRQNPDNPLRHDTGPQAGELVEPIFYTRN